MIFEPFYITLAKRIGMGLLLVSAYLWVSTDEYEFEQQELAEQQTRLQSLKQRADTISEPEPELPVYPEPEQAIPGWIVPPEPVRKGVAKVKRKIKKSVEKR